ncbi:hypothetical protein [Nocardia sp. XZ_19_385]|uniref:hypothetical protein n=1 Tax=Nocardia sp. XZ_19_385 TaxID=2769488 RepID=UPI00188F6099|nr:hypothetical protein [Nocardia sp. XZ_19_385]
MNGITSGVLATAIGVASLAIGAPTASAAEPTVKLEQTAGIGAKGLAPKVTAEVTCDKGLSGLLFAQVLPEGEGVENAGWPDKSTEFKCTGTPQKVSIIVKLKNAVKDGGKGKASASVIIGEGDAETVVTDVGDITFKLEK